MLNVAIPHFVIDASAEILPVGSRITCNPPVMDTDEDYLIRIDGKHIDLITARLLSEGWNFDGSRIAHADNSLNHDHRFHSLSLNGVNLIMTSSEVFFGRFVAASSVAKRLNLLDKGDRIALFQAVLYGHVHAPIPEMLLYEGGLLF